MALMSRKVIGPLALGLAVWVGVSVSSRAPAASPSGVQVQFFETTIRPLIQSECLKCQGGEKTKGGLELTGRAGLLKGGDSGPAVDLKEPGKSLLLRAVSYKDDELQMPPKQKLGEGEIA